MPDTILPTDSKARKDAPIARGVFAYFPLALAAVARVSMKGNEKHNPGQPMHWAREKSTDHADCILRHQIDAGKMDEEDGELHDAKVAWRALAQLQLAEEKRLAITHQTGRTGYLASSCGCWIDDNGTTFDCHAADACHLEAQRIGRLADWRASQPKSGGEILWSWNKAEKSWRR